MIVCYIFCNYGMGGCVLNRYVFLGIVDYMVFVCVVGGNG